MFDAVMPEQLFPESGRKLLIRRLEVTIQLASFLSKELVDETQRLDLFQRKVVPDKKGAPSQVLSHCFDVFSMKPFHVRFQGHTPIRYHYDVVSRLYSKIPTSMANESFVNHTNFHVQFSEILVSAKFTYENSNHSIHFRNQAEKTSKDPLPFKVGYHTPEMICFTRDSNESIGSIRLNDHMFLNIPVLNHTLYEETEMEIFVHYPGQLIRSLNNPILSLSFGEYQLGKMLEIKLSQGTVLRKRADSNEMCNDKIDLHDEFLMKEISKKFKCVPPYWTGVVVKDLILSQCTSPSILREVYTYIKDTKRMVTLHDPPCLDMYNAVTYNLRPRATEQIPMINFDYKEKYYEEIQYVKDFDIESFWSGIGGFVGIFLGYSMMQFPELIGKLSI